MKKDEKNIEETKVNYKHSKIVYFAILLFVLSIFSTGIHYLLNLNNNTDVVEQNSLTANTDGIYTYTVENGEATIIDCDNSASGAIRIPSTLGGYPVTRICEYAFSNGKDDFWGSHSLTSIILPYSLKRIDEWAFFSCTNLESIIIPNSVISIGDFAFHDCRKLLNVTIPSSVTGIGEMAFGCYNDTENEVTVFTKLPGFKIYCEEDSQAEKYATDNGFTFIDNAIINLSKCTVNAISNQTYTGGAIKPNVTVKNGSITLVNGTDYTVAYSNNINVGTSTVTITGKGNYTGTVTKTFSIVAKQVSSTTVGPISNQTYTGSAMKPTVTVKNGTTTLVNGTDYTVAYSNNINVGTATVTITGKGNFTGTVTKTFIIVAKAMSGTTVNSISNQTYTGSAIKPKVIVKNGTTTLVNGTDYTVAYTNNTKIGTATVTITGKGKYTGTKKVTFNIIPKTAKLSSTNLSKCTVSTISNQKYTGKAIKPTVTVKNGSTKLVNGTNYTVAYTNNTKIGTATVTIKGKGKYTGTKKVYFNIVPKTAKLSSTNLSKCTVSTISNQTYTGSAMKPTVTVKNGSTTLVNGTNYTVAYTNNTKIGTATVTIKGKGKYTGTKKVTFNIIPKTAKLSSVKSSKTKQITISWSKDTTVTGYQIMYSTNSKFASGNKTATITKNSTVSKTITKLTKGKKYYAKVRGYKTVSGKKIYGSWSAVKNIKCK